MNAHPFVLAGVLLHALPSGGVWWPDRRILAVSDLHLGKSDRVARRGGPMLPPYETVATLTRLRDDIDARDPATVICLGDSFDDAAAADTLDRDAMDAIAALQAGRDWIWIEGNHERGPTGLAGTHRAEHRAGPLTFRHIARPDAVAEVSGHYHPKAHVAARGRRVTRPCFLYDARRLILPAYGTYTGGLGCDAPALQALMAPDARAILLHTPPVAVPMPRAAHA